VTAAPHPPSPQNLWIEVDAPRLTRNVEAFRRHVGEETTLAVVVKSNGYGHGFDLAARAFVEGGADWLCVHSFAEAMAVRSLGLGRPILVLGPLHREQVLPAVEMGLQLTVYDHERLREIAEAARSCGQIGHVHLKVETGTYRQGLPAEEVPAVLDFLKANTEIELAGLSSHFANIEDTTRHEFAASQIERFDGVAQSIRAAGLDGFRRHMASSAAAILFPHTHYDLVRIGISAYGYWPSRETLVSAREKGLAGFELNPALTWKTRVAQVKNVPAGSFIGYGCTHKVEVDSRIAVLAVGYADGYRRDLGGRAWVLIRGRRCPLRGRVCMNLVMVDVTHLPEVEVGEEVVLLGRQGDEELSAETLAEWAGTIHYEVLAALSPSIVRGAIGS
jgi:alanine racemase